MGGLRWVVAPRREQRGAVDPGWQAVVRASPGVHVVGGDALRLTVEASAEAVETLRTQLGAGFLVEPVMGRGAF